MPTLISTILRRLADAADAGECGTPLATLEEAVSSTNHITYTDQDIDDLRRVVGVLSRRVQDLEHLSIKEPAKTVPLKSMQL